MCTKLLLVYRLLNNLQNCCTTINYTQTLTTNLNSIHKNTY